MNLTSKTYRNNCQFKRFEGNDPKCTFPKLVKSCQLCTCYLRSFPDGSMETNFKYVTLIYSRKVANMSLAMSFLSLLISFSLLVIQIIKSLNISNLTY